MRQVGEWPSMMREWVRVVGKGLLACVVVGVCGGGVPPAEVPRCSRHPMDDESHF